MPGYEYNPLTKLDLQKKSAVSPSDIQHLEQEIASINEDITDINGDLKNKVPKFFVSIEELEIGEIGQYQGETNETFTRGYFYQRGEGVNEFRYVEEAEVTIVKRFSTSNYYQTLLEGNCPTRDVETDRPPLDFVDTHTIPGVSLYFYVLPLAFGIVSEYYVDNDVLFNRDSKIVNGYLLPFARSRVNNIEVIYQTRYVNNVLEVNYNDSWLIISSFDGYGYANAVEHIYSAYIYSQNKLCPCWFYNLPGSAISFYGLANQDMQYSIWNYAGVDIFTPNILSLWTNVSIQETLYMPTYVNIPAITRIDTQPSLDPSDFATAAQGAKADTALQSISVGTDGNYLTTTIGTKDANNNQTVGVSAKIQDIETASNDNKGFAESSNVKAYAATAAQGTKADTALQGITHGNDGNYVTSTIGAKDANNEQSVSVSLTMQAMSTASASAKGVAEASDVKDYIGNNTATPQQGSKADSALQSVVHGTDGLYISTTVSAKDANNKQTIYSSLTLQDIETADASHKGVAEASNVRNFFNVIAAESEAYGVMWDTANPSPTLTRIGNMRNHALLPVQSQIVGGVLADDGSFTAFDNQDDWTQASQARDGSVGQVMVQLPQHWRRCERSGTYNVVMISPVAIPGYVEVRQQYVSAYEATLQHSTSKLCSVNNADADYRGGQNEASWDGTYRTLLNRPITNYNLAESRTYARNRGNGTKWNCLTYEAVRTIYWLFVTEYATLNSQADFNSALDSNGFHQGGLGIGASDWTGAAWNAYNGYAPLIPCGILDEYGSGTAIKNFSIYNADTTLAHTFSCNKYRGIEMPFAHLWKYVDGVLVNVESGNGVSTVYATTEPANFSSTSFANYAEICNSYRVDSYIKDIVFNEEGDIFATVANGSSTSYFCDQYWGAYIPSATELRAWPFGGDAHSGAICGLACAHSYFVPGARHRYVGSRLCFIP